MPAPTTRLAALAGLFALTAVYAQARTLEVGEGKSYKMPSLAAAAARDGDVVKSTPESISTALFGRRTSWWLRG